jgi:stage III sporulation protein AF
MGIFKEWIQNMVVFLLLMTMAGQLIPDEKYKKYIRLTMGLLLILVLVLPLCRIAGVDGTMYQNYLKESIRIAVADASGTSSSSENREQMEAAYTQIIREEIEAYFDSESMTVKYCELSVAADTESSSYGKIERLQIGIAPKANDQKSNTSEESRMETEAVSETAVEAVHIPEVSVGENSIGKNSYGEAAASSVPEEKIEQWEQDLMLQFGIDAAQLELEILL